MVVAVSPTRPSRDAEAVDDLPHGSLLVVGFAGAVAAFAPFPLAVAVVLLVSARVLGLGPGALLVSSAASALPLALQGLDDVWHTYLDYGPLWRLAQADEAPVSLLAHLLPIALPAGALVASVLAACAQLGRPFWIEPRPRRSVPARIHDRRERCHLRSGRARLDARVGLGLDPHGRVVSVAPEDLRQHALILGATGSGKTTTLLQILRALVPQRHGVLVVDLKADPRLAAELGGLAEGSERTFEFWTLEGPARWDPLARGDATELMQKLVALEEWSEPHYKRAAQRYLLAVLSVLRAAGESIDLAHVAALLDPRSLADFLYAHNAKAIPEAERARVEAYVESLDRSSASAIQGLANRIAVLVETAPGPFLAIGPDSIDLERTFDEGRVTLFSLDAQKYGETAAHMAALVAQDVRTVTSRRLRSDVARPPGYVVFDEFSAIRSDHLLHLFAQARAARLGVLLATQELADLSRVDAGFADQVLANTNVKLIHRQDVPESAERLAGLAGTRSAYEETFQTDRSPFVTVAGRLVGGGRGRNTGRGTIREVEQYVVHPNVLKQLRQGTAILIQKHPRARVERVTVVAPARSASDLRQLTAA